MSRQACDVPIAWRRALEIPVPKLPSDPLLVLARHLQLEHLRSRSDVTTMDERWAGEVARELARLSACDWRRGPAVLVRVHSASRSELGRLLQIGPDRVVVSSQLWLERGAPVMLEHADPQTDCFVRISGHCLDSTLFESSIAPTGQISIVRSHRRREGPP